MGSSEHLGEQLGDHLFRRESGRIVATLTRIFGVHNLALAEDVVQDAFCRALEVWKFRGVPENPSAWLMVTAKKPRARRASTRAHRPHLRPRTRPLPRKRMDSLTRS
jgi:predicted RNA polymerase sigma factor